MNKDEVAQKAVKRLDNFARKIEDIPGHGKVLTMTPLKEGDKYKNYLKITWDVIHTDSYGLSFYLNGIFSNPMIAMTVSSDSTSHISLYTGDGSKWSIKVTRDANNSTCADVAPIADGSNAQAGFRFGASPQQDSITITAEEDDNPIYG